MIRLSHTWDYSLSQMGDILLDVIILDWARRTLSEFKELMCNISFLNGYEVHLMLFPTPDLPSP